MAEIVGAVPAERLKPSPMLIPRLLRAGRDRGPSQAEPSRGFNASPGPGAPHGNAAGVRHKQPPPKASQRASSPAAAHGGSGHPQTRHPSTNPLSALPQGCWRGFLAVAQPGTPPRSARGKRRAGTEQLLQPGVPGGRLEGTGGCFPSTHVRSKQRKKGKNSSRSFRTAAPPRPLYTGAV